MNGEPLEMIISSFYERGEGYWVALLKISSAGGSNPNVLRAYECNTRVQFTFGKKGVWKLPGYYIRYGSSCSWRTKLGKVCW
jgi:hypothetical protein